MGAEGHIVSKMYCFTEQSEAVGGGLLFICLVGFLLLLLFSLILLICPLSAFLYIYFQFPLPPLAKEQETRLSSVSWHPKKYKSTKKWCILFSRLIWIHRPALERHLLPERVRSQTPEELGNCPGANWELIIMWILFDLLGWLQERRMGECDKLILLRVKNYLRLILPAVLMGGWIADLQGLKSDWAVGESPDVDICEANSSANLAWYNWQKWQIKLDLQLLCIAKIGKAAWTYQCI